MRMRNYLGLFAFLISASQGANAAVLWSYPSYNLSNYASLPSLCQAMVPRVTAAWGQTVTYSSHEVRPTDGRCSFKTASNSIGNIYVSRSGTCDAGTTYDPSAGSCNAPFADQGKPCPDQTGSTSSLPMVYDKGGQCVRLDSADQETTCKHLGHISLTKKSVRVRGQIDDKGEAVPPPAFKAMGCAADVNATTAKCTVTPAKVRGDGPVQLVDPPSAVCTVDVVFNGKVANELPPTELQSQKEGLCLDQSKCNLPTPQQKTEEKPCVYVSASDGSQSCVRTSGVSKEGKTQCGTVNGVLTCSDSLAKPVSNGVIVWTKVNSEGLGDGKTKVVKTDKMTSYTCGAGKSTCTSSTTTNTTTTIKDGSGKTESVTGSCEGPACPDKNGNPDGDGDGFGDCTGDKCGDETTVGAQDWYQKGEDTYSSVLSGFSRSIKQTPVISGLNNFLKVNVGGTCPVWQVKAWVFDIRLDQWCGSSIPWELIRAVVLACAAFIAFRIAFQ